MVRLFKVKEWEDKKRALAAESDVYRQTLNLEIQNLRLYTVRTRRKFNRLLSPNPVLTLVMPLLTAWLKGRFLPRKKGGKWWPLATSAFMTWQLYRKFRPLLSGLLSRFKTSHPFSDKPDRHLKIP